MDGSIPSGQMQPAQPVQQVVQEVQAVQPWHKMLIQKALANKTLSLFIAMNALSLFMGGYVLLAPSTKTVSNRASAYIPPTPIPLPTNPPPIPTAIATPAPTEEVVFIPTDAPTPTQIPTPTPTIDPTANWNTYLNTEHGYTIKYPLDWAALNLGTLEPKVPSYIVFNPITATTSARTITISVSTRTYIEQLAIGGTTGIPITVASIEGKSQSFSDSDGNTSVAITLPREDNLLILRAKTAYASVLYQMLPTLFLIE